jgi:thiol-disulfide isomerase/thioredoxin
MKLPRLALLTFIALMLAALSARAAAVPENIDILAKGGKGGWLNVTRPLTAADIQSHPVILLDFWTYGCINCQQVVPDLEALEKEFGDKLLIIGVHSAKFTAESGNDRILAAAKRFGLKHPVINDSDFAIWKAFGVQAWPTLVLMDSQGNVIRMFEGEGHKDEIAGQISKSLTLFGSLSGKKLKPAAVPLAADKDDGVLSFPARLAVMPVSGKAAVPLFFVADSGHNRILSFDGSGAVRSVIGSGARGLKDGDFKTARFDHPRGIAVFQGDLYVADTGNHALRRVDLAKHTIETVAGTGARGEDYDVRDADGKTTALASPWDVEPLADGHTLAIAMAGLHQIWTYDTKTGGVKSAVGSGKEGIKDGPAIDADLAQPSALSRDGDTLFFADAESSSLRQLKDGQVKTLIGTGLFDFGQVDGQYPKAMLQHAQGIFAASDKIYIADTYNNAIRVYDRKTATLKTVPLSPKNALFEPGDVLAVGGDTVYVADTNHNRIVTLDLSSGALTPLTLKLPH